MELLKACLAFLAGFICWSQKANSYQQLATKAITCDDRTEFAVFANSLAQYRSGDIAYAKHLYDAYKGAREPQERKRYSLLIALAARSQTVARQFEGLAVGSFKDGFLMDALECAVTEPQLALNLCKLHKTKVRRPTFAKGFSGRYDDTAVKLLKILTIERKRHVWYI